MALHHELPGLFQYIRQRMGEYKQMYPSASPQESFQKGVLEYGMRLSPSAPPFQGRGLVFSRGRRAQVAPGPAAPAPAPAPAEARPEPIRIPAQTPSPVLAPAPTVIRRRRFAPEPEEYIPTRTAEIREDIHRYRQNLGQLRPRAAAEKIRRDLDAQWNAMGGIYAALARKSVPMSPEEMSDRVEYAYEFYMQMVRDRTAQSLLSQEYRQALLDELQQIGDLRARIAERFVRRPFGVALPIPSRAQERAAEERRRSPERDPGSPLYRPISPEVAAQKQAEMRQQAQRTQARRAAEPEGIPSADVSQIERVPTEDVTITAAERAASPVMSFTQGDVAVPRAFRAFRGQGLRGGNDASLAAYLRDWMNRFAANPEANRARAEAELRDYFLNEPQDGRIFDAYYETAEDMEMYDMDDVFDYVPAIIEMAEQPYEDELYQDSDDMEDVD
jgi:hypothetical protein